MAIWTTPSPINPPTKVSYSQRLSVIKINVDIISQMGLIFNYGGCNYAPTLFNFAHS